MLDKRIILNVLVSLESVGAYAMLEADKDLSPDRFSKEIQSELVDIGYLVEVKE
jgi:hypothetical protein